MKKMFSFVMLLVIVLLLSIVSSGYCDDFPKVNGIPWGRTDTYRQLSKQLPKDLVYIGGARGGVSTMTSGFTAVPLGFSLVKVALTQTKAITIADGEPGQIITLLAVNDGAVTVTLTPATATGWATVSFDAAGESLTLRYLDDTYGWIIENATGATVTAADAGE